jgi:hypothetical protein
MTKYPNVKITLGDLAGPDGNAFMILGKVTGALKKAGVPKDEVDAFLKDATSAKYDHLLATAFAWVNITYG